MYSSGKLTEVTVYANSYEAGTVDIEYNWIFVLRNPLLEDDKILLKFPPNDYNLKQVNTFLEVVEGLVIKSSATALTTTFDQNVVKITGFSAISKGTMLHLKVLKVKNPQNIGFNTDYFAIET